MSPTQPDSVADLVARRRIEKVAPNPRACAEWINDARRHLASAAALADTDPRLAYAAVHDAARKAITAHMNANGLRPASGDGSHRAVIAYARERMAAVVDAETLDMVDQLREGRARVVVMDSLDRSGAAWARRQCADALLLDGRAA